MVKYSNLAIGEKLRHVREAKGLSIENMADAVASSKSSISRFERGEIELTAEILIEMRKFLGIEKAPLLEYELDAYKNRIQVWKGYIIRGRFAEARAMQEDVSVILGLPFEHELYLLYLLIEATFLALEYNVQVADQKLSIIEGLLDIDSASNEALNLYYRSKGFICGYAGDLINSIKHSLKAVKYAEADKYIDTFALLNVGFAYSFLGKYWLAIIYFERGRTLHLIKDDITSGTNEVIGNALGTCYLAMGEYRKAEEVIMLTIAQSKSLNNKGAIGEALYRMALIKLRTGMYDDCMDYCNQAQAYHKESKEMYVNTLICKVKCMLEMKRFDDCPELLNHGKTMLIEGTPDVVKTAKDSDDLMFYLNAIEHLMTIDDNTSINFIQDIAIPRFRAGRTSKFDALYFCNKLEAYYTKKRAKTKANAIAAISRDIYKEIFMDEVVLD